jgi:signal transduction histidine kinase
LNGQLAARLDELRASRRRLVETQDAERRRLERDIHDGAQQQLVALSVKLRLAGQLAGKDRGAARTMLEQVGDDTADAIATLRDLAGGIYPRRLADEGLVAALQAQAGGSSVAVTIEPDGVGRYTPEVEAAVYFCALEALQNVSKYAGASSATVRLAASNGDLRFEVTDDGAGFDAATTPPGSGLTNMRDRLDALGGTLTVESTPGSGTTVRGRVATGERVPA